MHLRPHTVMSRHALGAAEHSRLPAQGTTRSPCGASTHGCHQRLSTRTAGVASYYAIMRRLDSLLNASQCALIALLLRIVALLFFYPCAHWYFAAAAGTACSAGILLAVSWRHCGIAFRWHEFAEEASSFLLDRVGLSLSSAPVRGERNGMLLSRQQSRRRHCRRRHNQVAPLRHALKHALSAAPFDGEPLSVLLVLKVFWSNTSPSASC